MTSTIGSTLPNLWDNPDLLVITGSQLYGCSVPESDTDTRGFVLEPFEYLLGRKQFEQHETLKPDTVIWSFKKFFKLLEGGSPNVVELLFAPEDKLLKKTPVGELLLANRGLFIAKRLVKPIQGFALSEWNKAVRYHEHIRQLGASRKSDIAKHGYSVKNAYHAIRLLEECVELLECGTITFPRPNADFLRKVRHGEITEAEITERWLELDVSIPQLVEKSSLPENVDRDKLDALYYKVIKTKTVEFVETQYKLLCPEITDIHLTK